MGGGSDRGRPDGVEGAQRGEDGEHGDCEDGGQGDGEVSAVASGVVVG